METLEILAARSVKQHEEINKLLEELINHLSTQFPGFIENFNSTFCILQKNVQQTDLQFTVQYSRSVISDTVRQLIVRRKSLQEQMSQLLEESVPRASSLKSLLASEMQTLKTGRRAINGYRNTSDHQGKIINKIK